MSDLKENLKQARAERMAQLIADSFRLEIDSLYDEAVVEMGINGFALIRVAWNEKSEEIDLSLERP